MKESNYIYQVDKKTNEILYRFTSAADAERKLPGVRANLVIACCRGSRRSHAGYKWEYVDPLNILISQVSKAKIRATKENSKEDYVFESIAAASRALGLDSSNITKCCKGKRKSVGGYTFNYIL